MAVIAMSTDVAEAEAAERVVARFLHGYHKIWQNHFPGLNKRAHWHVMFSARCSPQEGVSCRSIHRALYGLYGTDIRTCIERVRDCENDDFIRVVDASGKPCPASPTCLIRASERLHEAFDDHCRKAIEELCAIFGDGQSSRASGIFACSIAIPLGVLALERSRSAPAFIAFIAMGMLAWIPGRALGLPAVQIAQLIVWPVACAVLVAVTRRATAPLPAPQPRLESLHA